MLQSYSLISKDFLHDDQPNMFMGVSTYLLANTQIILYILWQTIISVDNLDRSIPNKHAGINRKDTELHMVHGFIKLLEILPDDGVKDVPKIPIETLKPDHILPNNEHFQKLKGLFIIHCLRIVFNRMPELTKFRSHITKHIKHKYSDDLQHPSVTVRILGVCNQKQQKTTHELNGKSREGTVLTLFCVDYLTLNDDIQILLPGKI